MPGVHPHHELRLRERWFGELNGTPDSPDAEGSLGGYPSVWAEDATDPAGVTRGVETVTSVVERATAVIAELEAGTHPICRGAEEEEEWAVVRRHDNISGNRLGCILLKMPAISLPTGARGARRHSSDPSDGA